MPVQNFYNDNVMCLQLSASVTHSDPNDHIFRCENFSKHKVVPVIDAFGTGHCGGGGRCCHYGLFQHSSGSCSGGGCHGISIPE